MFDGKTLQGWRETAFTGHGKVRVENGTIVLGAGRAHDGRHVHRRVSRSRTTKCALKAARIDGNDFFASLTFPVGDSFCTWVTGGWGGDIVGLSSLDGWDASDNETRTYFDFEKGRWYAFRLQVTPTAHHGLDRRQADHQRARSPAARLACGPARFSSPPRSVLPPTAPPERCAKSSTGCCVRLRSLHHFLG